MPRRPRHARATALVAALALALALAAPPAAARTVIEADSTELRIGVHVPDFNVWTDNSWNELVLATELALADVQADPGLLPNTTVVPVQRDVGQTFWQALDAAQAVNDDLGNATAEVALVVGGGDSGGERTVVEARALGNRHVNFVAAFADATELSDDSLFPYVHRMLPAVGPIVGRMLDTVEAMGWARVAVVSNGASVLQSTRVMLEGLEARGIAVLANVQLPDQFDVDGGANLATYYRTVRDSGARVVLFMSTVTGLVPALVEAEAAGLMTDEFTWVYPQSAHFSAAAMLAQPQLLAANAGNLQINTLALKFPDNATDPAQGVVGLAQRAVGLLLAGGATQAPEELIVLVDMVVLGVMYDAVYFSAVALHNVMALKQLCARNATEDPAGCDALAAEAGDDDATLRRVLRTQTTASSVSGFPLALNPLTGDRVLPEVLLQHRLPEPGEPFAALRGIWMPGQGAEVTPLTALDFGATGARPPNDEADVTYVVREVSGTLRAVMGGLAGAVVLFACAVLAVQYRHRSKVIVRMTAPRVTAGLAAGGVLLLLGAVYFSGQLATDSSCASRVWTLALGFTLLHGVVLARAWRVHRIFNTKHLRLVKGVRDSHLVRQVALLLLLDAAILSAWQALSPPTTRLIDGEPRPSADNPNDLTVERTVVCDFSDGAVYALAVALVQVVLVAMGLLVAYQIRSVNIKALNDSMAIAASAYLTALVLLIVVPAVYLVDETGLDGRYSLVAGGAVLLVASVLAVIYGPVMLALARGTHEEWTVPVPAATPSVEDAERTGGSTRPRTSSAPFRGRASSNGATSRGTSALSTAGLQMAPRPSSTSVPSPVVTGNNGTRTNTSSASDDGASGDRIELPPSPVARPLPPVLPPVRPPGGRRPGSPRAAGIGASHVTIPEEEPEGGS